LNVRQNCLTFWARDQRREFVMATLKVTAKGQVTLNKEILRHLGIGPGDHVDVEPQPGKVVEIRPQKTGKSIESVFGILHDPNGPRLKLSCALRN
jgi:AbrB family looped-hinge helix DNA binding protein